MRGDGRQANEDGQDEECAGQAEARDQPPRSGQKIVLGEPATAVNISSARDRPRTNEVEAAANAGS